MSRENKQQSVVGLKNLSKIARENVWMLAVDAKFYAKENGPSGFEKREPGSVQGILNGLKVALQKINQPLSIETIQLIHKTCVQDIKTQNPVSPGNFRTTPVAFEVLNEWFSIAGLIDLLTQGFSLYPAYPVPDSNQAMVMIESPIKITDKLDQLKSEIEAKRIKLFYGPPSAEDEEIKKRMSNIIKEFNKNIKSLKKTADYSLDQLLSIIIETIQKLMRTHPFRDGNNRTFVALLNALLIQNGFSPCIFFDPNIFEFHLISELLPLVNQAMENFKQIANNPDMEIFGFQSSSMTDQNRQKYEAMGKEFLAEVAKIDTQEKFVILPYTNPDNNSFLFFASQQQNKNRNLPLIKEIIKSIKAQHFSS